MRIRAASFGDRAAFNRLLDQFDVLPVADVGPFAGCAQSVP